MLLALAVDRAGQAGLVVGGVVPVDDALAGGAVVGPGGAAESGLGGVLVAGGDALADAAGVGLQGRADRLVADAGLLVLPVALDLRLDVRQERALLSRTELIRIHGEPGEASTAGCRGSTAGGG